MIYRLVLLKQTENFICLLSKKHKKNFFDNNRKIVRTITHSVQTEKRVKKKEKKKSRAKKTKIKEGKEKEKKAKKKENKRNQSKE